MRRLKTALMGLGAPGHDFLAGVQSEDRFELIAVADADSEARHHHADESGVQFYEDYRSLIVESGHAGLDLLVVAEAPFRSAEFVEMAASRNIAVFHRAPWARHVDEGRRIVRRFENHACPMIIARWWQFDPAFALLHQLKEHAGHVYAAAASVKSLDTPDGWRGDSTRAGGGVLLHGAYEVMDLLIHTMGMPETVYAQNTYAKESKGGRPYDTEDFATVSLRFSADRAATITAVRNAKETDWQALFYGTRGSVHVSPDRLVYTPANDDAPIQRKVWAKRPIIHALSAVAESLLEEESPPRSTAREHLTNMAVIQAAYLSAKTGDPESPSRMLGDL